MSNSHFVVEFSSMATELSRFLSEQLAGLEKDHSDRAFLEHIERLTEAYNNRPKENPLNSLTARQTEVLSLVAQGFSNGTIAGKLVINRKVVENYINTVFDKMHISGRDSGFDPRVQSFLLYQNNTPDFKNPVDGYFGENKIVPLTPRQREVVSLIGKGYSNLAIATELNLSIGSVMGCINRILNHKIPVDHQVYSRRVVLALVSQTLSVV